MIDNICIFVTFPGEPAFTISRDHFEGVFNNDTAGANSVRNYFLEVSYSRLSVHTFFLPAAPPSAANNPAVTAPFPRSYYQPYDGTKNTNGYVNALDQQTREHQLVAHVVNAVAADVAEYLILDGDKDGAVDCISLVFGGSKDTTGGSGGDGWGNLLWPHSSALALASASIRDKSVGRYTVQFENTSVGTFCHEMFHTLGAPDLYHYNPFTDQLSPAWRWDLMGSDNDPPQHMNAHMKRRYGEWMAPIQEITSAGTYLLAPMSAGTNHAYRLPIRIYGTPLPSADYVVLEYRRKLGTFENGLQGSGLLIWRISGALEPLGLGNLGGPPDECYAYRPGGTLTDNGNPSNAFFTVDAGRVRLNSRSNPSSWLSTGVPGDLFIADIGPAGEAIDFYAAPQHKSLNGLVYDVLGRGPLIPFENPHWVYEDVTTPAETTLTIWNGARIYFEPGARIRAVGAINIDSGGEWTRLLAIGKYRSGLKCSGQIRLRNGGAIKLH